MNPTPCPICFAMVDSEFDSDHLRWHIWLGVKLGPIPERIEQATQAPGEVR